MFNLKCAQSSDCAHTNYYDYVIADLGIEVIII